MLNFSYANPTRLVFGRSAEHEVGRVMTSILGRPGKVLVLFGGGSAHRTGILEAVEDSLQESGFAVIEMGGVQPNPRMGFVRDTIDWVRDQGIRAVVAVGGVLGVALAVLLFFFLPAVLFNGLMMLTGDGISGWRSVFEGLLRIVIFVLYIVVISKMPEIDRTFRYHGAEHKTIFCYENDLPLTVENVRKQKRFHPRCGSSFMILMLFLGIIIGFFIPFSNPFLRTFCKLLCLPIVVSIGYELIKLCGKYDNVLTRIIAAPGLWFQRLTVKEPTDKMMEAAIAAMKAVIPENGEDIIR